VPELQSRLITGLAFTATDWLAGDTLMRPTPDPAGGVVTIGVAVGPEVPPDGVPQTRVPF